MKAWLKTERAAEWGLFLLALLVRLISVAQYTADYPLAQKPVIDEASYHQWACRIADGDWLGQEVFFQEPLYSYALGLLYAVFGKDLLVARLAQALLWALTAVLVKRLSCRVFDARAGWIAGALLAIYGPGLLFPAWLLKENLFLPLLASFALLLVQAPSSKAWLALGILGALGALLRGNMLVLLPIFAGWAWRQGWQRALAFAGGVLLMLLPVAWRNAHVGGVFALTTAGAGTNLYGGNNVENPYGRASEFSFVRGIPEHEAEDWEHEAERRLGRELDRGEVSRYWLSEVGASIARDPLFHAQVLWHKLRLSLGRYEVPDNHFYDWDRQYLSWTRLPWPDFGLIGALSLAGLLWWLWRGPRSGAALALALLFALYLGTIVLTVTSDRARLPLVVLLLPFGGHFLAEAWRWKQQQLLPRALCLVLASAWVWWPCLPAGERERDFDERDYNYAVQSLRDLDYSRARELSQQLSLRQPRSARVRLLAIEVELRNGTGDRPALFTEVALLAQDPRLKARERFHADRFAGELALELRESLAAVQHLRSARRFDPEDAWLAELLAQALAQAFEQGRSGAEVLEEALSLVPPAQEGTSAITRAGIEFLSARERLRVNHQDPLGRERIEAALDRLRGPCLDKSLAKRERGQARRLAGTIQLELGRKEQALNHFKAALALDPSDAQAAAGLAAAQAP